MASNGIKYYLSVFLFSVSALVFLPSCVVPPSRKEREKPEISREKKEKQKVEWKEADAKKEAEERKKAEAETKDDSRTGITWVEIKGGGFQMGSDTGDSDERPVRQVNIKTFWMAKTQVTVAQYRKCVDAGKCSEPPVLGQQRFFNWNQPARENHPANGVTWDQASAYCKWAGGRLPSEAEWEYVARSRGKSWKYPWGNEKPTCERAVMDDGGVGCGKGTTGEVCSKPKGNTEQGLCDMAGNVWEWVEDDYHGSYDCDANPKAEYCENGGKAPSDGSAWVDEPRGSSRVIRGGGFNIIDTAYLRVVARFGNYPTNRGGSTGFRCAMDPAE